MLVCCWLLVVFAVGCRLLVLFLVFVFVGVVAFCGVVSSLLLFVGGYCLVFVVCSVGFVCVCCLFVA